MCVSVCVCIYVCVCSTNMRDHAAAENCPHATQRKPSKVWTLLFVNPPLTVVVHHILVVSTDAGCG